MDEDLRLKRHTQLWEENNKSVRRTIAGGLIFAVVVLLGVLYPSKDTLKELKDSPAAISTTEDSIKKGEQRRQELTETEEHLSKVSKTIKDQPWRDEIEELKEDFRARRLDSSTAQSAADKTVTRIANELEVEIKPLRESKPAESNTEFSETLDHVLRAIEAWKEQNLGKRWYRTLEAKERAAEDLGSSLHQELQPLSKKIKIEKPKLDQELKDLHGTLSELQETAKEQRDNLQQLEAKMQTGLPDWARGLVSVEQMVQIYPFILLGVAVYLLGRALALTHHYHAMAMGSGWSSGEQSDPVLSSLWTLTYRGRLGTALTIGSYVGVFLCLWLFFEAGMRILEEASTPLLGPALHRVAKYGARFVLLGAIAVSILVPIRGVFRGKGVTDST